MNRVYAEDPYRGFLPSTGRLVRYRPPTQDPPRAGEDRTTVRVDDGVVEGSDISIFYVPMIAKLITHAPTREAAIDAQIAALDRFEIDGIGHNVDFLSALMQHPRFRAGDLTTGFIAEEYPYGFHGAPVPDTLTARLAAVAGIVACGQASRAASIDGRLNGRVDPPCEWIVTMDGAEHHVVVGDDEVTVDGAPHVIHAPLRAGQRLIEAVIDGEPLSLRLSRTRAGWRLTTRGRSHDLRLLPPHIAALSKHMIEKIPPDLSRFLLCPMPGLLTRLTVAEGDQVEAGQPLAVVEAMKMEEYPARRKGRPGQGGRGEARRQPRGGCGDPRIRVRSGASRHAYENRHGDKNRSHEDEHDGRTPSISRSARMRT